MNTQAASEWNVEVQRNRDVLLNYLLLTAAIGGLAALILNYFSLEEGLSLQGQVREMWVFALGWLIAVVAWAWRGLGYRTRAWVSLLLTYSLGVFIFYRGGLPGSGRVWMLLIPALAFTLLGPRAGMVAGIASILTYLTFSLAFTIGGLRPLAPADDPNALRTWGGEGASFLFIALILTLMLRSFSQGWLDALMKASAANKELEETNVQLYRQTSQLQATTEIAQAGSSILDPDELQVEVVNRIQERFSLMGVYYVGLLLLDETGGDASEQPAVLKAATGEAGRLLLEMGYKMEVDETTTVGWCITHQQACTAVGIGGTVRLGVVPMPNTRSEIALPLRSRGRVLGALNAHSTHEAAFSEDDIAVLQTMADQVAVAIENAQLFSKTEAALKEVQIAQRRYLTQAWREFLAATPVTRVDYIQPGMELGDGEPSTAQTALTVPLMLRGQVIGTMALHETRHQQPWTAEETALAETIAEQVAQTVENLRLLDETQRHAVRERAIGEIADRMQRATDMETLVRITAEELNQALGGSRAYVHLSIDTGSKDGPTTANVQLPIPPQIVNDESTTGR